MVLIDGTYFTGELSLPNLPTLDAGGASDGVALALQTVGENNLDVFVDKYVREYLVLLFGGELTGVFLDEMEKSTPDGIWLDLKDQLLMEFGSYKRSPLANYVYYRVMRDACTKTTQAGEADPDFDNAENVGNGRKLMKAWNDMADMTVEVHKWFCHHAGDYEAYVGDCTGRHVRRLTEYINLFNLL
jgi:hypothetical protein